MGKYDKKLKRWKQISDAITVYLAKDMVPVYTVEKSGFKQLVGTLDKQYKLPSRKYFTKTAIPTLYNTTRDAVAAEIRNMRYFLATTDLWSSEWMKPYLSYTIHFICNWKLLSRCLQTSFMPEDHTGENIAEVHLAITNSIKCDDRCTRALGLARKIVSTFSMSWKKRRDLAKAG